MPVKQRRPYRRDLISTGATTAETVEQLALEGETLKCLETMVLGVLRSGVDAKWSQLNRILDDDLMVNSADNRGKLIIFRLLAASLNHSRHRKLTGPDPNRSGF